MQFIKTFGGLMTALLASHACYALDEGATLKAIREADAAFATSSFQARVLENGKPVRQISSTSTGDKYRFRTVQLKDKGSQLPVTETLFDGQDEFSSVGNSVTISRLSLLSDTPNNRMLLLLPGACFFKGRGLSMLKSPHVSAVAGSPLVELQGQTPNGKPIRALLDPRQKFLARRIERLQKEGKPFVTIETQGAQNGGLMPQTATVKYPSVGTSLMPLRFEFSAATFSKKPAQPLQFFIARPAILADTRFGAPLIIRKTSSVPMTKADVFAITDKEAKKLGVLDDQEHAAENRQRNINLALTFGPLTLAALLLAWRTKKRV